MGLGVKKAGIPDMIADIVLIGLKKLAARLAAGASKMWPCSTRRQNSVSRSILSAGRLPAINEALIAPIEVPMTQSGSTPAS